MNNTTFNSTTNYATTTTLQIAFSYIRGVFFIYGGYSNFLIILVCLHGKLKDVPNFIFYSFMSLCSIFHLIAVSLVSFILQVAGSSSHDSLAWCRTTAFFNSFTYEFLSWLVGFYTLEIYLSIHDRNFRKKYPVVKVVIWVSTCAIFVLLFLNSSAWFIVPHMFQENNASSTLVCSILRENTNFYFLTPVTIVNLVFFLIFILITILINFL